MEPSFTSGDEDHESIHSPAPAAVPVLEPGLRLLFRRLESGADPNPPPHPPHTGENPGMNPPTTSPARRCLFPGSRPSVDEIYSLLDEHLAREREEQRRKWNFDFEKMEPLPGRYLWEPVFSVGFAVEGSRTDMYNDPVVFGSGAVNLSGGVGGGGATRRRGVESVDESVMTPSVGSPRISRVEADCDLDLGLEQGSGDRDRVRVSGMETDVESGDGGAAAASASGASPRSRSPRQSVITEHMRPLRPTAIDHHHQETKHSIEDEMPSPKRPRQE